VNYLRVTLWHQFLCLFLVLLLETTCIYDSRPLAKRQLISSWLMRYGHGHACMPSQPCSHSQSVGGYTREYCCCWCVSLATCISSPASTDALWLLQLVGIGICGAIVTMLSIFLSEIAVNHRLRVWGLSCESPYVCDALIVFWWQQWKLTITTTIISPMKRRAAASVSTHRKRHSL